MDGGNSFKIRVGLGYDVHPFQEGRDLFLGGIKIPFHKGLKGHSDGGCFDTCYCGCLVRSVCPS